MNPSKRKKTFKTAVNARKGQRKRRGEGRIFSPKKGCEEQHQVSCHGEGLVENQGISTWTEKGRKGPSGNQSAKG